MDADQIRQIVADAIAADRNARANPLGGGAVAAVGVKLPEFWVKEPTMWFQQAEAVFRRSNITVSFTKYNHVLMKLPEEVIITVKNLVASIAPTDTDAYERLKDSLTAAYSKSRWQQVFELIRHPDLGDRRPSRMMSEMLALLPVGSNGDDTYFLGNFLIRLPASLRDHLVAADCKTAADMAAQADKLWDARAGDAAVTAVTAAAVSAVSGRSSSPRDSRHRSPDRRRSDSNKRQPRRATPGPQDSRRNALCFYHGKFGKKAHRCEAPCAWTEN